MSVAAPFVDPRRVVLFSGHRVDPAGRVPPRFPDDKAEHAGVLIERALRDLDIGPGDLALTQGSSGGDLLFAEAAARRGARLRLMQPASEPRFIEESVRASANGDAWVRRYLALRAQLPEPPLELPAAPDASRADRFERCNHWLLDTALGWGPERMRFVCLWDGSPSARPGGTAQMVEAVRRLGVPITWLDVREL
ncbi:MAG: hypothetical protein ABIS28_17170 [Caldimonas sp.]